MTVKEPALREIILDILLEVLEKGKYSHVILSQALTKYQYLEKQDRSFIKRVVDGTVEYRIQLDYILNSYSKVKVNKRNPGDPHHSPDVRLSDLPYGPGSGFSRL